jgi:programmed cell death 6-interacting protein
LELFSDKLLDSQNNLKFEIANILYNLAGLYSQLATTTNRLTSDGLKVAAKNFALSAGVISYLKSDIIPEMRSSPPEDMDDMTLECVMNLMLAQAQECYWQKAKADGLKDNTIAKLAAKVCDFYLVARDFGVKSDAISVEWIHHMTAKHHHFASAAQFRAACNCLDESKYGEEIARLKDSLECANEALKEGKWINKIVLADLQGLKSTVSEHLKRAEKDNDMIYLCKFLQSGIKQPIDCYVAPIPQKSDLAPIGRVVMAKSMIPKEVSDSSSFIGDNAEFGKPLFAKLVPFAVHNAANIYASRRDHVVNKTIIDELNGLTAQLHDELRILNLPGSVQALEKPLGLPPGLLSHAEEIRQQNGVSRLVESLDNIAKLKSHDESMWYEAKELLESEAREDTRARMKYGTERWNRPPIEEAASQLTSSVQQYQAMLQGAKSGDDKIIGKLKESEKIFLLLQGPDRDLEEYVPSSRQVKMPPRVESEVGKLRGYLDEASRLESRRRRKIEALRQKAQSDDISKLDPIVP